MISKFDLTHSPKILIQFEGNLDDSSGNGLHLTPGTTPVYRHVWHNTTGMAAGTGTRSITDAALKDGDDYTLLTLCVMQNVPSAAQIAGFVATGETEAVNAYYLFRVDDHNTLRHQQEYGAGLNDDYISSGAPTGLPSLGVPFLLGVRRKNGIVSFWVNYNQFGAASTPKIPPTGGGSGFFQIGGGTNQPALISLKFIDFALTDGQIVEEYSRTMGDEFGAPVPKVLSLWTGAPTHEGITSCVQLTCSSDNVRLVVEGSSGTYYSDVFETTENCANVVMTGLDPDTEYTYKAEVNGVVHDGLIGKFKTCPAPGAASFMIAFSGDAITDSNHIVFDTIRQTNPLLFIHLGDAHYRNISNGSHYAYNYAYNVLLRASNQERLYREVPTAYIWDDHDYGPNDSDATYTGKSTSAQLYRARIPHYPTADSAISNPIYQSFEIGRVLFIMTDQRSAASVKSATDNSSKSILGTTQKAWFKNLLSNSPGKAIVWVCSRTFGGVPTAGADHWGGFTTERKEIADHIKANCHGRVMVISADRHGLDIDNGSHHDFATGGGEPIKTFQASPLDRDDTLDTYGGGTYSEGSFGNPGQFGTMEVVDTGGSSIDITWKGWDSSNTLLMTYSFTVNV